MTGIQVITKKLVANEYSVMNSRTTISKGVLADSFGA